MIYALYAFGAFVTAGFFMCGLFLIAAIKLSSRISREEEERNPAYSEHSIHCACEGALIDALITNPTGADLLPGKP